LISAKVLDKPTVYGGGDVLLPSVQHSGSYYVANVICEGKPSHLRRNGEIARKKTHVIHGHYDVRHEVFKELSRRIKTVIPVRHPALIAVSWKKRGPAQWRTDNFLTQWNRMHEIDGFLFPIEQKPFDELEDYLGAKVNRLDRVIHSIGEYNEKRDLETARNFLGSEWALVQEALQTPIGRKFYVDSICGL
jgi:hypothetical protein